VVLDCCECVRDWPAGMRGPTVGMMPWITGGVDQLRGGGRPSAVGGLRSWFVGCGYVLGAVSQSRASAGSNTQPCACADGSSGGAVPAAPPGPIVCLATRPAPDSRTRS
jgi:hypothetical protein